MLKNTQKTNVYLSEEGYNLWAKHYDLSRALLNGFEKGNLIGMMGDLRGKKVLDLGAGTGRLTEYLLMNGAIVTAFDISEEMLKILKKKYPQACVVKGDVKELPFEDQSFDIVVAGFLIVHLKDLWPCFREVYRVLKTPGEFFVTNINQKKAPKLKMSTKEEIVIKSFYHRPEDVLAELKNEFFDAVDELFIEEEGIWINQIIKALKK